MQLLSIVEYVFIENLCYYSLFFVYHYKIIYLNYLLQKKKKNSTCNMAVDEEYDTGNPLRE